VDIGPGIGGRPIGGGGGGGFAVVARGGRRESRWRSARGAVGLVRERRKRWIGRRVEGFTIREKGRWRVQIGGSVLNLLLINLLILSDLDLLFINLISSDLDLLFINLIINFRRIDWLLVSTTSLYVRLGQQSAFCP
jgi:hypothetical protein